MRLNAWVWAVIAGSTASRSMLDAPKNPCTPSRVFQNEVRIGWFGDGAAVADYQNVGVHADASVADRLNARRRLLQTSMQFSLPLRLWW